MAHRHSVGGRSTILSPPDVPSDNGSVQGAVRRTGDLRERRRAPDSGLPAGHSGFRLFSEADLGVLFVEHLGLLLVDTVRITRKVIVTEPHKGPRRVPRDRPGSGSLVELSHPITSGMVTYPGLPGPEITDHLSRQDSRSHYAAGTEFHIGHISMVANTGTYLDAPSHRFADGDDLSAVGLVSLVSLPALVVRLPTAATAIDHTILARYSVRGRAVLLHTGWDRHWGTDTYGAGGHPYLTLDGAAHLAQAGTVLVGTDAVNIDDTTDGTRPAHTTLLSHGISIVEHLRGLDQLPPDGFHFTAAPPLVVGMGTFPVRAYAIVD